MPLGKTFFIEAVDAATLPRWGDVSLFNELGTFGIKLGYSS